MKAATMLGSFIIMTAEEEGRFEILADQMGVSRQALRAIVEDENDPSAPSLRKIAKRLEITMERALELHEEKIADGPEFKPDHSAGGVERMRRLSPGERKILGARASEVRRMGRERGGLLPGVKR